jgi:hypothetical protein
MQSTWITSYLTRRKQKNKSWSGRNKMARLVKFEAAELEDWHKAHRLALRTELATGKATIDGKQVEFSVSLNIDNKAIFVEFPDNMKITYHTNDLVADALDQYHKFLKNMPEEKKQ